MRKKGNYPGLAMMILSIGLTVFLPGCRNLPATDSATDNVLSAMKPVRPAAPAGEAVRFEARDGGLWLSYDNYRALERNIIAMREYAARLEIIIGYYEGEL